MSKKTKHPLRDAGTDRTAAEGVPVTPQTQAPAYKLAFNDFDFRRTLALNESLVVVVRKYMMESTVA